MIDGSHRLSALIAWVHDDCGDGSRSQEFFNHTIPDDQLNVAKKTRDLVEKEIGPYSSHRDAISNPAAYGPDIIVRARALGSRPLQLQWVRGDADKAEASFIRINQRAVMIDPQELELIEKRRKPQTIAARAIIRRGTGHKYWSRFGAREQQQIEDLATELHKLIFEPALQYPITSLDLPAGGAVYSGPALRMVYDFIALSVSTVSADDDIQGQRTVEYLTRCRRVMHLLLSKHASSLGLHPAIYFYSWTGNQQPILFLAVLSLVIDWDRANKLKEFTLRRRSFEEFLVSNRTLINQIVRKFGTKSSGMKHLRAFYEDTINLITPGISNEEITQELIKQSTYSYLQPGESPYEGVSPTRMSTSVKAGLTMRKLLETSPRCSICGAFISSQAITIDHKQRRADGGSTTHENTDLAHPYCNTGYKESQHAARQN